MTETPTRRWRIVTCALLVMLAAVGVTLRFEAVCTTQVDFDAAYFLLAEQLRTRGVMVYDGEAYAPESHLRKPPVLPYVLATFPHHDPFRLWQAALSAALLLPIFLLGWRWHSTAAGLVAAGLWTFWGPGIALAGRLRPETMFYLFFLTGLLLLGLGMGPRRAGQRAVAGMALAVAELTRTVLLPFVLLLLAFEAWRLREAGERRRRAAAWVALAAGFFAPIAGYQLLNLEHGLAWVYDHKGEVMLLAAIHRHAEPPYGHEPISAAGYFAARKPAGWVTMTDAERERFTVGLALREHFKAPGRFLNRSVDRLREFWLEDFSREPAPQRWLGPSAWLSLLALVGFFALRRPRPFAFAVSAFLAIDFSMIAIFLNPKPVYREMVTPWLLTLAAIGAVSLAHKAWGLAAKKTTPRETTGTEPNPSLSD
jgi:hypothetical protein